MRLTDDELRSLAKSNQKRFRALAEECIEARERGLMPSVDLATRLATNRIPCELAGQKFIPCELDGALSVCAFTPENGGKGRLTQVHLVFDLGKALGDPDLPLMVHRMKSGPGVDQLIRLLAEYRAEVWPNYRGVRVST